MTPTNAPVSSDATPSPFHLTDEQVAHFDQHGYLILRQQVTGDLLERLRTAADAWIDAGLEGRGTQETEDYAFANRDGKRVFFRINYLHEKGDPASLALLGCPQVLAVAESLCGRNFVPTYESMVFKMSGDGEAIKWHQDAIHPRTNRIFNYDLYLDASKREYGALRVLPGTQTGPQDICELSADNSRWDFDRSITVEMEPGDVLLHDVMVVHGSPRSLGGKTRRTIYYEFRAGEQIQSEGPWDLAWVRRRMRLLSRGIEQYGRDYPEAPRFDWRPTGEFRPDRQAADSELRVYHDTHTGGAFCSAGSVMRG